MYQGIPESGNVVTGPSEWKFEDRPHDTLTHEQSFTIGERNSQPRAVPSPQIALSTIRNTLAAASLQTPEVFDCGYQNPAIPQNLPIEAYHSILILLAQNNVTVPINSAVQMSCSKPANYCPPLDQLEATLPEAIGGSLVRMDTAQPKVEPQDVETSQSPPPGTLVSSPKRRRPDRSWTFVFFWALMEVERWQNMVQWVDREKHILQVQECQTKDVAALWAALEGSPYDKGTWDNLTGRVRYSIGKKSDNFFNPYYKGSTPREGQRNRCFWLSSPISAMPVSVQTEYQKVVECLREGKLKRDWENVVEGESLIRKLSALGEGR